MDAFFTDRKGRRWDIDLTWNDLQMLKREAGLDIEVLVPKKGNSKDEAFQAFNDFISDGFRLFETLWLLLKAECERRGITQEDFGDGFNGAAIESAGLAFTQGLINFFPNQLQKALLEQMLNKGKKAMEIAGRRLAKEMDKVDLEKTVNEHMDAALASNALSGKRPEPPASLPQVPTA